ncbi:MAG: hypothetical protein WCK07_14090 [Betaproteobacteria bacterium]
MRYAERVETYDPNLGMPHTRSMGDERWGVRFETQSRRRNCANIIFAPWSNGRLCCSTSS